MAKKNAKICDTSKDIGVESPMEHRKQYSTAVEIEMTVCAVDDDERAKWNDTSDWAEFIDNDYLCYYYFNETTGETVWVEPSEGFRPSEWRIHTDDDSGVSYFSHVTTGEVTWTPPPEGGATQSLNPMYNR